MYRDHHCYCLLHPLSENVQRSSVVVSFIPYQYGVKETITVMISVHFLTSYTDDGLIEYLYGHTDSHI